MQRDTILATSIPQCPPSLNHDSFGHGYVSNFAFGASVAYKAISVGIEHRWAKKATYNGLSFDEEGMDYDAPDFEDVIESDKWKMKSKSFRVFLGFRY